MNRIENSCQSRTAFLSIQVRDPCLQNPTTQSLGAAPSAKNLKKKHCKKRQTTERDFSSLNLTHERDYVELVGRLRHAMRSVPCSLALIRACWSILRRCSYATAPLVCHCLVCCNPTAARLQYSRSTVSNPASCSVYNTSTRALDRLSKVGRAPSQGATIRGNRPPESPTLIHKMMSSDT